MKTSNTDFNMIEHNDYVSNDFFQFDLASVTPNNEGLAWNLLESDHTDDSTKKPQSNTNSVSYLDLIDSSVLQSGCDPDSVRIFPVDSFCAANVLDDIESEPQIRNSSDESYPICIPYPFSKLFHPDQKKILNQWYEHHESNPYPRISECEQLSTRTGLTIRQIRTYFSNRRARDGKRKHRKDPDSTDATSSDD